MGFIMDHEIEDIYYIEDKHVCDECFEDYAIKDFIEENAISEMCTYCGRSSADKAIATKLYEVVIFILEGIRYEWDEPVNCVGWCSQEGGWVGATITDTHDLIAYNLDLEIQNTKLFDDIIESFNISEWCQRDPYGPRPEEEMFTDWEEFAYQIKHKIRYVFFKAISRKRRNTSDRRQPFIILKKLGDVVNDLGLIKSVPAGSEIMRARVSTKQLSSTVKELGPPHVIRLFYPIG